MENLIFSGNAVVQFEGNGVFEQMIINQARVTISLVTNDGLRIVIKDHRPIGIGSIMSVMRDPMTAHFYHHFQSPAQVMVYEEREGDVRIDLHDTFDNQPAYHLSISGSQEYHNDQYPVFKIFGFYGNSKPTFIYLRDRYLPVKSQANHEIAPFFVG